MDARSRHANARSAVQMADEETNAKQNRRCSHSGIVASILLQKHRQAVLTYAKLLHPFVKGLLCIHSNRHLQRDASESGKRLMIRSHRSSGRCGSSGGTGGSGSTRLRFASCSSISEGWCHIYTGFSETSGGYVRTDLRPDPTPRAVVAAGHPKIAQVLVPPLYPL